MPTELEELTDGERKFLASLFEIDPERFAGVERLYRDSGGFWMPGGVVVVTGLTMEEREAYMPRLPYGWWVTPDEETYVAWIRENPSRALALG